MEGSGSVIICMLIYRAENETHANNYIPNFLEHNTIFSKYSSYADLECINRTVYPRNSTHLKSIKFV